VIRHGPRATWIALAITVIGIAGCGGGDEETPTSATKGAKQSSPSAELRQAHLSEHIKTQLNTPRATAGWVHRTVEGVLTLSSPVACHPPLVTESYVIAAYGDRQGCLKAQSAGSTANRVDFKSLRVAGDRATAVVIPSGGLYDGERITVSLIRVSPHWSVNALRSNARVGP
jgi:hypothetical protein